MKEHTNFITSFNAVASDVHDIAVSKGFWNDGFNRNKGEMIALIHSELSEGLEATRHGNPPSDHIPEYTLLEEELADAIIRIMDFAYGFNLRVAAALLAKMEYNKGRDYLHGKEF